MGDMCDFVAYYHLIRGAQLGRNDFYTNLKKGMRNAIKDDSNPPFSIMEIFKSLCPS